ncbi:MAG: branched-chain amino acid ABC transporter permease [Candidatus Thermofonsia Clade 3 bacterium]|uniref:Branched-chain amino acid ABC transporter permease n=1 Tax=Candidatus Thermofonsia Clade 3 bacterium TaxID=2364212 RepID=A0A2M8QFP9_9CHLR|nr:MAG: branched-chain amino acid ABC transporter permease [Candidatus Thermofonsia Clade 3 bacterium]
MSLSGTGRRGTCDCGRQFQSDIVSQSLAVATSLQRRAQTTRWIARAIALLICALVVARAITVSLAESYPLTFWASQLVNGLVLGGVYALVALGYTLVYGILLMINFAHGEVMMIGGVAGFFALQLAQALGWMRGPAGLVVVALLIVMGIGMVGAMFTGVALERIAYRPLRNAPRLVPLISAIGASLFLQYSVLLIFGVSPLVYQRPALISGGFRIGPVFIPYTGLIIFVTSLALMGALFVIVQRTRLGRAMRAVAADRDTAALMGVDVNQIITFTFLLGSALAGAAGVMLGFHNSVIKFNSGFIPGLKAFTAAVMGGIGNIPGAMVGALVLGIAESIGPSALGIPAEYKDIIAFVLLVLVLIFRPQGLLGEALAEKKV